MLIAVFVFLTCILSLVGVLLAMSPGKPASIVEENGKPQPGSISVKIFVNINDVEQGMFIIGKDTRNPVLLVLHGGLPEYFLTEKYPTGLENLFTVVWWEQRGSGISYRDDIPKESITPEQLITDTLALTNYLRQRFGKEKIYLMGHSGGTFFGIQVAARHPELYHAYIGVAQIAYQIKSEMLAYDYMLQEFKKMGNEQMSKALEAAPVTMAGGTSPDYLAVRDIAMHRLGIGTTHGMHSILTGLFFPSLAFRGYTLLEKINFWRGKARNGVSVLWDKSLYEDMSQQVPKLDLPVYFLEGIYDYTCNYNLAKAYLEQLKAPVKGFYTFTNSAHSPHFEEPEKTRQILQEDVLTGTNKLAVI